MSDTIIGTERVRTDTRTCRRCWCEFVPVTPDKRFCPDCEQGWVGNYLPLSDDNPRRRRGRRTKVV